MSCGCLVSGQPRCEIAVLNGVTLRKARASRGEEHAGQALWIDGPSTLRLCCCGRSAVILRERYLGVRLLEPSHLLANLLPLPIQNHLGIGGSQNLP